MLDLLLNTLIARGDYQALRGYHQILRIATIYIAPFSTESENDRHLVTAALDYAERYSKYPTYPELEEFVNFSSHRETGTSNIGETLGLRCLEIADAKLAVHQGSWAQIVDEVAVAGRSAMYVAALRTASSIIAAGATPPDINGKKQPDPVPAQRVAAAMKYMDQVRSEDFTAPPSSPEGAWRDNAGLSADALIEGLKDTIKERCYMGFRHIDDIVAIGPKQTIRYIGVLGFTNHGKSLVLRSMAYNMAQAGKRILYIALEDGSALNCWTKLSFLHAYERRDLDIPNVHTWTHQPQKVTVAQQDNLRLLVDDVQHGTSVPGEIVVRTLNRWADIVQELEIGHNGKPFDVLMIDYVSHLKTTTKDAREEIRGIFKDAQSLSQTYKGGRGLVVVTPLQSNKASMKAADESEDDDWGVYPDLGSIEQFTDAGRDMDLVIAVWQKGSLKDQAMMKLSCLKSRETFFEPHFVQIDRRTGKVLDLPGHAKANAMMIHAYRLEAEEAELTPEDLEAY